jgi:hypothetical protein
MPLSPPFRTQQWWNFRRAGPCSCGALLDIVAPGQASSSRRIAIRLCPWTGVLGNSPTSQGGQGQAGGGAQGAGDSAQHPHVAQEAGPVGEDGAPAARGGRDDPVHDPRQQGRQDPGAGARLPPRAHPLWLRDGLVTAAALADAALLCPMPCCVMGDSFVAGHVHSCKGFGLLSACPRLGLIRRSVVTCCALAGHPLGARQRGAQLRAGPLSAGDRYDYVAFVVA